MAKCDAHYKFIFVDVGAYGSEGDGGVFGKTTFGRKIYNDELPLPNDLTINNREIPFYFVSDDVFMLCNRVMKPYVPTRGNRLTNEERIFNYRLSRARRCIENAFGILSTKWLCLNRTLQHNPDRSAKIILACCCLHNYLISNQNDLYCPRNFGDHLNENGEVVEGEWRKKQFNWESVSHCNVRETEKAKAIRNELKDYVNSPVGSVPWQNDLLN